VPGVERVGFAMYSPMEGNNWSSGIAIRGRKVDPDRPDSSSWNRVSAHYFETVGTRVLRGRAIDERDTPSGKRVVVVNESFVKRFFAQGDPIGGTVGIGGAEHAGDYEIVGVVEDVKYSGATQREVRPMMFLPSFQTVEYADATMRSVQARSMLLRAIVVAVQPAARDVEAGIRQGLAEVDQDLNVIRVLPLTLQVNANFRIERLMARLTSLYGLLALALAALGLYGVTAYGVSQRTREIGVRMALGADGGRIMRTCVRGPFIQTCIGLGIGLAGAIVAGRSVSSQLYDVAPIDPVVLLASIVALVLSAVVAAALPSRRAVAVNPATALRGE
jgi:predicted permease